jgi:transcriptional antiterminator NusG
MEDSNQPLEVPPTGPAALPPAEGAGEAPAPAAAASSGEPTAAAPEANPPTNENETPPPEVTEPAAEQTAAPAVELPAEAAASTPTESIAETPAEPPATETGSMPTEEAAEVQPVAPATAEEAPAESVTEMPAEAAAEAPAESVAEAPTERPAETPSESIVEAPAEPAAEAPAEPVPKSESMNWYILKVQSNREDSIREGLLRRVAIAGLDYYFGEVIVPMERVTEFKGGKKRIIKRKLYPGYLVVQMEINDDTWFLVRETPGIGDFTGAAGRPTPMHDHEIERILVKTEEKGEKAPKLKIAFREGDRVKIKEGTFENFEGQVDTIDQTNGQVTVMINIFGRSTPVTLEYWQIEAL